MSPGILKRIWMVLSVPWSAVFALVLWNATDPNTGGLWLFLILLPWIVGPVIFYAVRFIFRGTFSPPPPIYEEPPEKVHAEWKD